jgi:hypothetical protein
MTESGKADETRKGLIDSVKGKAKEVVGAVTGNDSLTAAMNCAARPDSTRLPPRTSSKPTPTRESRAKRQLRKQKTRMQKRSAPNKQRARMRRTVSALP